ncbi:MAG: hypothetical protein KGL39_54065 [Patescibacteria group bacterium]|nr:hypothetical protein [Patescibacteria group bacterium]
MKVRNIFGPIEMGIIEAKWVATIRQRFSQAWRALTGKRSSSLPALEDLLLNSGRADFKLHINNVCPDGSIDMWIAPDPKVPAIPNPVQFSLKKGRIE